MLCVIFWVVPRRVVFNSRHFGTLCLFHLHRQVDMNCVKVESYVVEGGTDRPSPLWGHLQVAVTSGDATLASTTSYCYLQNPPRGTRPVCTSLYNITLYLHTLHIHLPMKMEQTQCSEMSAIKHHTAGNNPKNYTQHLPVFEGELHYIYIKKYFQQVLGLLRTWRSVFQDSSVR
jgi:hypothetical protein